jgi:hypothetical protein
MAVKIDWPLRTSSVLCLVLSGNVVFSAHDNRRAPSSDPIVVLARFHRLLRPRGLRKHSSNYGFQGQGRADRNLNHGSTTATSAFNTGSTATSPDCHDEYISPKWPHEYISPECPNATAPQTCPASTAASTTQIEHSTNNPACTGLSPTDRATNTIRQGPNF